MAPEGKKRLGERMKELIKRSGRLQREIAEEMGVPEATLSRYVRGDREPAGPYLRSFARAVGCTTEALYREDDEVLTTELMDLLLRIANLVKVGENTAAAVEKTTEVRLTVEEWQMLAAKTANIRMAIDLESGGNWDLLRDEEKREVLERIAQWEEEPNPN